MNIHLWTFFNAKDQILSFTDTGYYQFFERREEAVDLLNKLKYLPKLQVDIQDIKIEKVEVKWVTPLKQ